MSNYWTQYWQQGHLTSFGLDIEANYQGPLQEIWDEFFASLTATDTVVDIGTGNGALLDLCVNGKPPSEVPFLTGIDLALVSLPATLAGYENKVTMIGGVSAENIPVEDGSITAVTSQFGLEYCPPAETIKEVTRVLDHKGKFQFVCHHPESIIVKPNIEILQMSRALKSDKGPLSVLKLLCKELIRHGKSSVKAEKLRKKLNLKVAKLSEDNKDAFIATNFPMFAKAVLGCRDLNMINTFFNKFENELAGSMVRLSDLGSAAVDANSMQKLMALFANNGLLVKESEVFLDDKQQLIGWKIIGEKGGH
ncbi:class I SAM-dependent methyltransferase [Thalassotalea litorea]|uniref:class I SAM-dependent methyltransferase n=1 Tax=Thalassotalea litorea TaxID=2020715 RepID=UPI003734FDB6